METFFLARASAIASPFKSYYVVWKLFFRHRFDDLQPGLNRTMQYGNALPSNSTTYTLPGLNRTMQYGNTYFGFHFATAFFRFKSYYVVWKPFFEEKKVTKKTSLNRTMQYGNILVVKKLPRFPFCLNRTMQYGNSQIWVE